MAYGGVISLKQIIQRLLHSSRFSLDSSTREILGSAYEMAASLQEILERLDDRGGRGGKRLDSLDGQIRDAVHKLEDFLELQQYSDVLLADSEQVMRQEISLFAETAKKSGEDYAAELDNPSPEEEEENVDGDDDDDDDSAVDDGVEMFARSLRPDVSGIRSIVGLKGSGRSYMAWRVFEDIGKERGQSFDLGVWVTVGANYRRQDILLRILNKVLKVIDGGGGNGAPTWFQGDEQTARRCLYSKLLGQRYMLVLDDVWDTEILDYLFTVLPILESNGGLVLLTTSSIDVAMHPHSFDVYVMGDALNWEDTFRDAFRLLLFRWGPFPPELEDAGLKIIRNCRGLPIVMSKVLLFLWSADRTPEAWSQIADDGNHPVFHVVDELSERTRIEEDLANLTYESALDKDVLYDFVDVCATINIEIFKKVLFQERLFPKMEVISIFGMAGIGKTAFVKKIFEYREYVPRFDHYVWITLGPKYRSQDILKDILTQIDPEIKEDDHDLSRELSNKRFFLALDDVWDETPLQYLADLFPNIKGRAMVTTRLAKVAHSEKINLVHSMHLLNKEETWDLFCHKVFGKGLCPLELVKAGKKIAENCDGLPLTVVKVANLVSKNLSPQYWNNVAKKNSDFKNALRRLSNKLLPSYKSLPHYLKLCFLYMGAFPENYEVSTSKVVKLWIAEGFLEPDLSQRVEDFAAKCLLELVDRSLLMVCQKGTGYGVKAVRLNSILWHLSNSEAERNNFFHAFNSTIPHAYNSTQGIKKQRRFCIRNFILFSFEGIHDAMRDSISTARSLLCSNPYNQYPPPTSVCFELRLLRVLDTLAICFYEFPIEVVELIHLRYFAITCNGMIPASISKLLNLQFLIVSQHMRIKPYGDCWYLPMEIWDMKELRHLQVSGSILPSPTCGTILPYLETFLDVSLQSCSVEVLRGIPNLKKLGIQIKLAPDDDGVNHIHHMTHISDLSKLESLKCVVVNPEVVFEAVGLVTPPTLVSVLSTNLEKLSLSRLGYPWECLNFIIHKLNNLKVLKLQCYAFKGHTWQPCDYCIFKKLEYILIEDTDLVRWKTTTVNFIKLRHLSIKHCYNLEQLPSTLINNQTIEVVDCNPYAMHWAKQMQQRKVGTVLPLDAYLKIHIECSWDHVDQPRFQRSTPREQLIRSLANIS